MSPSLLVEVCQSQVRDWIIQQIFFTPANFSPLYNISFDYNPDSQAHLIHVTTSFASMSLGTSSQQLWTSCRWVLLSMPHPPTPVCVHQTQKLHSCISQDAELNLGLSCARSYTNTKAAAISAPKRFRLLNSSIYTAEQRQERPLRCKEIKGLAQGHTASQCRNEDANAISLNLVTCLHNHCLKHPLQGTGWKRFTEITKYLPHLIAAVHNYQGCLMSSESVVSCALLTQLIVTI